MAERLILKIRVLANQPVPEMEALRIAGELWAAALIKAGIPPRLWEEIASLAGRARPSSGKAFMITADQVIDAWEHHLLGEEWSVEDQDWRKYRAPIVYCGQCDHGLIHWEEEHELWHGRGTWREPHSKPCPCADEGSARNSYCFRRFVAAYEIHYGSQYQPSSSDLTSVYKLRATEKPLWDNAVSEFFSAGPDEPTLEAFCGGRWRLVQ